MKKRGLSHLEVILSVILFIGAVGVAFFFFDPASSYRFGEPSYNYIVNAIEYNITTNVTIFVIKPNSQNNQQNVVTLGINLENGNMGLIIIDPENNRNNYDVVQADIGKIRWESNKFVFIHVSDDFPLVDSNIGSVSDAEATIASINTKKVISEKRAKALEADYDKGYNNYNILKRFFGISDNVNFGFSLDTIKTNTEPPNGLNVYSNLKRVEILKDNMPNNDPNYVFGNLGVRIW
ncbi:MAG: hypothetical protein AABW75_01230 [Nanoarchaeota archaeon]